MFRIDCNDCEHVDWFDLGALARRVRQAGFLRRNVEPDRDTILALVEGRAVLLSCTACGSAATRLEQVEEDQVGWPGQSRRCGDCGKPISEDRLEVFPRTTLCIACQRGAERGIAEADYCPRCGEVLQTRTSTGAGITRYQSGCGSCGYRG